MSVADGRGRTIDSSWILERPIHLGSGWDIGNLSSISCLLQSSRPLCRDGCNTAIWKVSRVCRDPIWAKSNMRNESFSSNRKHTRRAGGSFRSLSLEERVDFMIFRVKPISRRRGLSENETGDAEQRNQRKHPESHDGQGQEGCGDQERRTPVQMVLFSFMPHANATRSGEKLWRPEAEIKKISMWIFVRS